MNYKVLCVMLLSLTFGAVGCKKKDSGDGDAAKNPPVETVEQTSNGTPDNGNAAAPASLTPAQRAEMVGFAAYLPSDAEFLVSVHEGSRAVDRIKGSLIWKVITAGMGYDPVGEIDGVDVDELGEDAADEVVEEITSGPAMLFGQEFSLAMGAGTSDQLGHLIKLNSRWNFFQMSGLVQAYAASLAQQDQPSHIAMESYVLEVFENLLLDDQSGIGLFEKINMPPTYVAFKTTDEAREEASQMITGGLQFMAMGGSMVEPVEITRGDSTFIGYKIVGARIAEELASEKDDMQEVMPEESADRLIKAVSQKDLVIAAGIHEQYVVLFIGNSEDDLKLVDDVEQSLAGSDALTFCDDYASKDLLAVLYGNSEGLKDIVAKAKGGLSHICAGLRDGLASTDALGDTRNLQELLRMVEDREEQLLELASVNGGGTVAFFEEGLKIESFGGYDSGMVNWSAPNRLSPLGKNEEVVLFANLTTNPVYDARARAYIEALFETAYAGALKMAELPFEDQDMIEFKNYTQMFDSQFRVDLLNFWDGMAGGFAGSLGHERALVVDLKGSMPAIPGVPQAIVDQGKFPRASWIAPVTNRQQLGASWGKMNESLTSISKTLGELLGQDLPMQKPISSEKGGFTTWFFALPFTNEDCMPSVTVSDEWFAASTSKLQAIDLLQQAAAGGDMNSGFNMRLDFKAIEKFADESLKTLTEHHEDIGISKRDLETFSQFTEALGDIDSLSVHVRRDNGLLRSSIHFATR